MTKSLVPRGSQDLERQRMKTWQRAVTLDWIRLFAPLIGTLLIVFLFFGFAPILLAPVMAAGPVLILLILGGVFLLIWKVTA